MKLSKHFKNLKFVKENGIPFRVRLSNKLYAQHTSTMLMDIFNTKRSLKLLLDPLSLIKNSELEKLFRKGKLDSITITAVGKGFSLIAWVNSHSNHTKGIELIQDFDIKLIRPDGTSKEVFPSNLIYLKNISLVNFSNL